MNLAKKICEVGFDANKYIISLVPEINKNHRYIFL